MSRIGEQGDWFACGDCDWSTAGVWALEESDGHRAKHPGHVLVGDAGEWRRRPNLRVLGCPACDLYGYLAAWAEWEAYWARIWTDHANLVGPELLDDDLEPEGSEEHLNRKPQPPLTCLWLGELDDRGNPLQAIAKLLPSLACRDHDPIWAVAEGDE